MFLKLVLSGMKKRGRDYIILLFGLIISTAIFYMFENLNLNKEFLKNNSPIAAATISLVSVAGSILIGIITIVYIVYALSFLINMRQKDYGMYLMLGAKKSKIRLLIFGEIVFLGVISNILGILLGSLIIPIISNYLISNFDMTLKGFTPYYFDAIIWTVIFYFLIFIIAAIYNTIKLARKKIIDLLSDSKKPLENKMNIKIKVLQFITGSVFLAVGYWSLITLKFLPFSILIGMLTIIIGTYLIVSAMSILILQLLKKSRIDNKKLNNFLFSQLMFRIKDYNKILSTLTILFACALGAITIGIGFNNASLEMANQAGYYDVSLVNPTAREEKVVKKLEIQDNIIYHFKNINNKIIFSVDEFNKNPLKTIKYNPNGTYSNISLTGEDIFKHKEENIMEIESLYNASFKNISGFDILKSSQYEKVKGTVQNIKVIKVKDFEKDINSLKTLDNMVANRPENKKNGYDKTLARSRYSSYKAIKLIFGGLQFMGIFVGITFLLMLISVLMFKTLTGVKVDKENYQVLDKIGARIKDQKKSITKEIIILFLIPAILGTAHALIGLQMFRVLIPNPYSGLGMSLLIFAIMYVIYCFITIKVYQNLIIRKENKK